MTPRRQFLSVAALSLLGALIPGCSKPAPKPAAPVLTDSDVKTLYYRQWASVVVCLDTAYAALDPARFLDTFAPSFHDQLYQRGLLDYVVNRLDCDKFSRMAVELMIEQNAKARTDTVSAAFGTCLYTVADGSKGPGTVGEGHMICTAIVSRGGNVFEPVFWEPQRARQSPPGAYAFLALLPAEWRTANIWI